jgi:peroxiredoxin
VAICSNDVKNYPEDSFDNMIKFSQNNNFNFPYLFDETQEIAKNYGAVCTPDFFGYNKNFELQYRGRIRELKDLKPVGNGDSDLYKAMKQIAETGNGPKDQIPSMGCNIKWFN